MSAAERHIFSVTEINELTRSLMEETFPDVSVLGEVSNFKRHTSGHLYLTLKDASAQLRTVCFKGDALALGFDPEDGMLIVARGRITLYEPYGQYQLVARTLEKAGAGELERAFRALCEKLEREGLFATEHKQPLPPYPARIAVITSPTGAAVRDIVSTLRRRWPCAEVVLLPVHVQGEQAVPEITAALAAVPRLADIDTVILGRGGGSLEDLWAFNDEAVARAIFACPVPVISAVGHETDFTIADFVADARAATPTMAAEIAVPNAAEVGLRLSELSSRLARLVKGAVDLYSSRLQELMRSYGLGRVKAEVEKRMQTLDFLLEKVFNDMTNTVQKRRSGLEELSASLRSLSPRAVLARGYTMCSDAASGAVLSSVDAAVRAGLLRVTFHDGRLSAEVKEKTDEAV
jgi:exodeoxyribonuclease VII large subunit